MTATAFSRTLLYAIAFTLFTSAGAHAVRVAALVQNNADLEAAVTTALSAHPGVELLERQQLNKIAAELSVSGKAASVPGADLLVFVEAKSGDSFPARLTDARTGALIQCFLVPAELDPQHASDWLTLRLLPYLHLSENNSLRRFSLLGLRFETDSPTHRQTERALNLALTAAIQSSGSAVVLERWKLNDLIFEKELQKIESGTFWEAADLLDGSISEKGAKLSVRLRQRTSGTERILGANGETADLSALASQLANLVLDQKSPNVRSANKESQAYQQEAEWLLRQRLTTDAIQAVESAIALGLKDQTTETLRIRAYAFDAYPDDFHTIEEGDFYKSDAIPSGRIAESVASATTMSSLVHGFILKYSSKGKPQRMTLEYPGEIGIHSLLTGLKVLRASHEQGYWKLNPEAVRDLRQAIGMQIVALKALPLADTDQMSFNDLRPLFYLYLIQYAAYWNETPEKTLRFYDEVLSRDFAQQCRDGMTTARSALRTTGSAGPTINVPVSNFLFSSKPPISIWRLIDWDHPESDAIDKMWRDYVETRIASPDPLVQADGLHLLRCSCPSYDEQYSLSPRFVLFFENCLREFSGPDGDPIYRMIQHGLRDAGSRPEFNSNRLGLLADFEKLLNDGRLLAKGVVGSMSLVIPDGVPPRATDEEGRRLLSALSNYSEALGDELFNQISAEISSVRASIYRHLPNLVPRPPGNELRVSRSWIAAGHSPIKAWSNVLFDSDSALWHNGRLWLTDPNGRRLWSIDPASFRSELIEGTNRPVPPYDRIVPSGWNNIREPNKRPAFARGKMYLPEHGDIWVYMPDSNSWTRLRLPGANYSLWNVEDELFASFGESEERVVGRRSEGAGLYRINTSDDSAELLFSTRRRPPIHPLDSIVCERPFCVFLGTDGKPIVGLLTVPWGNFRRLDNGDEWRVIDTKHISNITSVSGETLFVDTIWQGGRNRFLSLQRVDRKGRFEVLLWNPENPAQLPSQPIWRFPDELLKATQSRGSDRFNYRVAMSGDDLYLFVCERDGAPSGTPRNDLYIFRRGQAEANILPLAFEVNQADEGLIRKSYFRMGLFKYPMPSNHGFLAVDSGLVIVVHGTGFWFIPFQDIEAAIQRSSKTLSPTAEN